MLSMSCRFIRNIRYYIVTQGWTYASLAERIGVDYSTVGNWTGGRRNPKFCHVDRLAEAFGIDPVELFKERR